MTTLSYTVPVAGTDLNSVADPEIATALTTIKTWANGNIDGGNVTATLTGRRLVLQGTAIIGASVGAETLFAGNGDLGVVSGAASSRGFAWSYLDSSNFAVTGKNNTQLILRMAVATNATPPGCNFTATLNAATFSGGVGGQIIPTAGSAASGSSVTISTPGGSSAAVAEASAFAFPSAGAYGLCVANGGTTAAGSCTAITLQLFALNS